MRRQVLNDRRRAIARSATKTIFDCDSAACEGRLDRTLFDAEAYLARASSGLRLGFRIALFVLQASPVFVLRRLSKFTKLERREKAKCIEALDASRLGLLVVLLKMVLCLAYFEQPDVLAEIGWGGPNAITASPTHAHSLRTARKTQTPATEAT